MDTNLYLLKREAIEIECYGKKELCVDEQTGEEAYFYDDMDFDLLSERVFELDNEFEKYIKNKFIRIRNKQTGGFVYYKIFGLDRRSIRYIAFSAVKLLKNFAYSGKQKGLVINKNTVYYDIDQIADYTGWRKPHQVKKDDKALYVLKNEIGRIKIGVSSNMTIRTKAIEAASGMRIEVIRIIENGYYLERKLHSFFKDKRHLGEWFNLNDEDVYFLINTDLLSYFNGKSINF